MESNLTSTCYNASTDTTYGCSPDYTCSGCDAFNVGAASCPMMATVSYTPYSLMECYRRVLADVGGVNASLSASAAACNVSMCNNWNTLADIFCTEYGYTCNFTGHTTNPSTSRYASKAECMGMYGFGYSPNPAAVHGTQFCQDKHLWFARVTANGPSSGPLFHCPHADAGAFALNGTELCSNVAQTTIIFSITAPSASVQQQIVQGITNGSLSQALFNATSAFKDSTSATLALDGVRVASDITWAATGTSATVVEVTMSFYWYSVNVADLYKANGFLSTMVPDVFPMSTYNYISSTADTSKTPAITLAPSFVPATPTPPTPPAKTSSAARSAAAMVAVLVTLLSFIIAL